MKSLSRQSSQNGQGMIEYVIIVALMAIAAIATYQFFGQAVRSQTAAIAMEIAGDNGTDARATAATAAGGAVTQGGKAKTLETYVGNKSVGSAGGGN